MKNKVQLITYVDRFGGGGLRDLAALLAGPLRGVFAGVHLLPFFDPIDGADAGFDPIDHTRVDPRLGDWSDVKALAGHVDVMADVIVNHVSDRSAQFLDFQRHGSASVHAPLFLTREAVFPGGANAAQLQAIYRPRPGAPFREITLASGERRTLWTTFTPQQIDIDVEGEQGRAYLHRILQTLASSGVTMVRLDAVGYAIKRAGTSCFMLPETFEFIAQFAREARALGIEVLVEVHSHYQRQCEIAAHVDWVYDFALPPLLLHALMVGRATHLKRWIELRPRNALTVLDTHDGIGIIDIGPERGAKPERAGLVPAEDVERLVEWIHVNSAGQSRQATGAAASNLDLYQVNCTYFDALGGNAAHYLLARAVQFFLPGVPQVYYVGLLAGHNDMALLARTGVGRDINRQRFSSEEVQQRLRDPLVTNLLELIRLRNEHPAFEGQFSVRPSAEHELTLRWEAGAHSVELCADLLTGRHNIRATR